LCRRKWLRRVRDTRAVHVTADGQRKLKRRLGLDVAALCAESGDSE
jgi:hypothetical protein